MARNKLPRPQVSNGLKDAVETYIIAKAAVEIIEPIVTGYQTAILARNDWGYDQQWIELEGRRGHLAGEVIRDPKRSYMLSSENFDQYLAECQVEMCKAGLTVEQKGYCPLLVAQNDLIQAKNLILTEGQYLMQTLPQTRDIVLVEVWDMKIREGLVDAIINLVISLGAISAQEVQEKVFAKAK